MGNECFPTRKFIFMSVDPNQYMSILEIIKEQNNWRLERTLSFMRHEDAKRLVNFKNEEGISLLMQACFHSKIHY